MRVLTNASSRSQARWDIKTTRRLVLVLRPGLTNRRLSFAAPYAGVNFQGGLMPEMPAFCDNCGTVFGSGFVFENCRSVTLKGNRSGPCPKCGGMGSIPDGVYDITENAIKLLQGSVKTVQQLHKLSVVLAEAQKRKLSKEQVQENIQQTVPELQNFASVLPQTRSELYGFIGILLAAIGLMISAYSTFKDDSIPDSLPEAEIEQMIERSIEESIQKLVPAKPSVPQKQKRNDPCACGSGMKYKRCCYFSI